MLLPQPLEGVMAFVRELVQDLTVSYNLNQPKPKEPVQEKSRKKKKGGEPPKEERKEVDPLAAYV